MRLNPFYWLALGLIWLYKLFLSPFMGQHCRYTPTCSTYAKDAILAHGVWAGSWMALARLSRCRPGGASGFDPVPEKVLTGAMLTPWRYGDWAGPKFEDDDDANADLS